jgi:hypothetical protein
MEFYGHIFDSYSPKRRRYRRATAGDKDQRGSRRRREPPSICLRLMVNLQFMGRKNNNMMLRRQWIRMKQIGMAKRRYWRRK